LIGFFLGVAGSPPAIPATTANAYGMLHIATQQPFEK
jgi:hypothetical protein